MEIKEKHLYRTEDGYVVYTMPSEYGGNRWRRCLQFINDDFNIAYFEAKYLIEEIPTPPIDFSRIGEMDAKGQVRIFDIGQWSEHIFPHAAIVTKSGCIGTEREKDWQPAKPPQDTIEVDGKRFLKSDVLRLKEV